MNWSKSRACELSSSWQRFRACHGVRILAVLSSVLAAAVEWRAIDHNPAIRIMLPKKTQKYEKGDSIG